MIKTLRITSIAAVVLAAIFFVFFVVFGVRSDEQIEYSPGVIERFNSTVGSKPTRSGSQVSPLVQQAQAFALYLNPPKPKTPRPSTGRGTGVARRPPVTPQFKVVGTCYYEGRPELSLVLVDEPGKEKRWVRQSGKVGHLIIEQIKDALIVVKDGRGTFEIAAEQKPEISLLEGGPGLPSRPAGVSGRTGGAAGSKSTLPASGGAGTGSAGATGKVPQPRLSAEQDANLKELAEMIKEIQRSFKSDKTGSGPSDEERAAMREKVISKLTRLSAEEARRLGSLGKELKDVWEELNRSLPAEGKDK